MDMLGVYKTNDSPETIQLKCTKKQADYLKSLPLHTSQSIETESETSCVFSYYLKPNYELTQQILSMGNEVEVMLPVDLRNKIAAIYKEAMAQNND
jgi:predicted DNA-binding transcriptional regulator YafY